MKKIQSWDKVYITSWKFKWTISTVISVITTKKWDMAVVKWVNIVKKAKKWDWFIEFEKALCVSNMLLWDEASNAPSRVWFRIWTNWKERFFKKSWNVV